MVLMCVFVCAMGKVFRRGRWAAGPSAFLFEQFRRRQREKAVFAEGPSYSHTVVKGVSKWCEMGRTGLRNMRTLKHSVKCVKSVDASFRYKIVYFIRSIWADWNGSSVGSVWSGGWSSHRSCGGNPQTNNSNPLLRTFRGVPNWYAMDQIQKRAFRSRCAMNHSSTTL